MFSTIGCGLALTQVSSQLTIMQQCNKGGAKMEVFTLYVGQGSLAVVTGESEAIVIDSCIPPSTDKNAEFMKAALSKILAGKNVVGLMLTGFDADHADPPGVAWILRKYRPSWVMYPKYKKFTGTAGEVFKIIKEAGEQRANSDRPLIRHSIRLDRVEDRTFDGITREWDIVVFSPHPEDMSSSNNSSLVAKIVPKWWSTGFRYLITGDTENPRWGSINRIFGKELRAEVMAAPHHGSKNAINPDTLLLVKPDFALINAGVDNQFGHPHEEAMDLYAKAGARVFSTHTGKSYCTSHHWLWGRRTAEWSLQ
jgi:beta-lactamase superfamily II metal-dependent hydrolase